VVRTGRDVDHHSDRLFGRAVEHLSAIDPAPVVAGSDAYSDAHHTAHANPDPDGSADQDADANHRPWPVSRRRTVDW
jgi:hypothetical protein